jgi:flagellar hook assembly protein FlgD
VYNVAGRMVKSLVSASMPAGRHTATWNGTDNAGSRVPSGVYFVKARYGAEQKQQRVIYLGQ